MNMKSVQRIRKLANRASKPAKVGKEHFVDTSHGRIRVLQYGFESNEPAPLYIDLHGGGFVLMTADSDEPMNLLFREKTAVKIISVDYPKAPEYPYPAAVEAVHEVALHYIKNAAEYGIDAARVGIGGHSAGANIATVICMRAKERGDLSFKFQLLDYPPLDIFTDPLKKRIPKKDITVRLAPMFNACYVNPDMAKDPHVSPIFATTQQLRGLPPALIIVAGLDSLHDEGIQYADMLRQAEVDVELHDFEKATHGFTLKKSNDSTKARLLMADFIARRISE